MDCIGRMVMRPRERERTSHYNLYRYCHNDPVNKIDPTGLRTEIAAEVQKLREVTGSHIKQWVTIMKLTMDYKGSSWKEAGMAAAAVAAIAAHSEKREYYGIVVRSRTDKGLFLATRPIPGSFGKVYGGYYNQSDLGSLRVPGWDTAAGYWGVVRYQNSWPMHGKESDLDVLKRTHTNAVLGIPPPAGAGLATNHVTYKIHDDHPMQ